MFIHPFFVLNWLSPRVSCTYSSHSLLGVLDFPIFITPASSPASSQLTALGLRVVTWSGEETGGSIEQAHPAELFFQRHTSMLKQVGTLLHLVVVFLKSFLCIFYGLLFLSPPPPSPSLFLSRNEKIIFSLYISSRAYFYSFSIPTTAMPS